MWVRHYTAAGTGFLRRNLVVESNGNVNITGFGGTIKYDSSGNLLWAKPTVGNAIALDENGNVCLGGSVGNYFVTTKYGSNGNFLWTRDYGEVTPGPGGFKGAFAIAVDRGNNIFVTGQIWDIEYWVWYTIKYDPTGNETWVKGGYFGFYEPFFDLQVDTGGNVYVLAGESSYDVVKYDPSGNLIWDKYYPASPKEISVDTTGNVYVIANSVSSVTGKDIITIKYSPLPQLKGDLNLDGVLDLNDVVFSLNCTFLGEPPPAAPAACDINCDGKITPADVVVLLLMVYAGMPAPC